MTIFAAACTRSLTACCCTNCGCPRSRFWDLGKHKLNARNHAVRDLVAGSLILEFVRFRHGDKPSRAGQYLFFKWTIVKCVR